MPTAARSSRRTAGTRRIAGSRRIAARRRRRPIVRKRRRLPATARRRLAVVGLLGVVIVAVIAVAVFAPRSGGLFCVDEAGRPIDPAASISGYGGEQLTNARAIIDAGAALGAPRDAQVIAVMTAMGESGLRVLDHGDAVGPDSRGLFQQRDNGAWGSLEDRMDPSISAQNFYRALLRLPDWQSLEPTVAAHRVQRNSDEDHYARYWDAADAVVAALTTRSLACGDTGTDSGAGARTDADLG